MRNWEEIKSELKEYEEQRMALISEFTKGECVECNVNGDTHYGRVNFKSFDQNTGKAYVCLKINKNRMFTWSTIGKEKKNKFFDDELDQVKLIDNPFDKNKYNELIDELYELDDQPLSKSEREDKQYEIQEKIMSVRQNSCIHDWEEVEEGSWLNKETVGYKCSECGLRLDKEQETEGLELQFD